MDFTQADVLNEAIRTIGIRHRALAGALLAPLGLYPGQEVILLALDADGARTQGQLAIACGCEAPTITGSVRKLEAAGLVLRRDSPTDRRVSIVTLTDRGRVLMPSVKEAWRQLAEQTVAGLASASLDGLSDILADLAQSLATRGGPPNRSPSPPHDVA
ncbi:MarR family winged helix-turn-helix transcriptional regulator [Streptomyces sp. NPDC002285]